MKKSLKYAFILLIGSVSWVLGSENATLKKDDFFGQFIAIAKPVNELQEALEKKNYKKALSLLQKIQTALDYIQTAADDLRIQIDDVEQKNLKKSE